MTALNPAAPIDNSHQGGFNPAELFQRRVYAPASLGDDVIGWLALEEAIRDDRGHLSSGTAKPGASPFARHGGRIRTFAITRELPIGRDAFQKFLGLLSMSAGPRLLRVKGLVHDRDEPERPRVIHAVQRVVYPPAILDGWPGDDHRTRLVLITDGIDPEPVRQLFEAALDGKPIKAGRALRQLASAVAETFRSGTVQLVRAFTG